MDTVGIRVGAIRKLNEEATLSIEKRILFWGSGLIVFVMLIHLLSSMLLPFVAGILIAYFLDPVADRMEAAGVPRGIASAMKSGMFAGQIASEAIKKNNTSEFFLSRYLKLCKKDFTKRHNKIYAVKETIQKLSDEELDNIATQVSKINSEKITLAKVFTAAIMKKPSLIIDVMRMFAGF